MRLGPTRALTGPPAADGRRAQVDRHATFGADTMRPSNELEQRLLDEIMRIAAIDVHSHVPPAAPFARTLRDLLGYHYFTELAHSAGMSKDVIADETGDEEMLAGLVRAMEALDNTVQYSWMIELSRVLFGFRDERLTEKNWRLLDDAVRRKAKEPGRERDILRLSSIEKVFLTNSFDEDLSGIDREIFVPSLRADTLVFRLHDPQVRAGLCRLTRTDLGDAGDLAAALQVLLEHFRSHGAASLAISLPPQFKVFPVVRADLDTAVGKVAQNKPLSGAEAETLQSGVLFALVDLCRQFGLPLQVMVGAVRDVYRHGVPQGTDLPQAGDTLLPLMPLVNAFPDVTFLLSTLSDSQAHELASYGWIVRNIVVSGHWWYDTIPAYIERDLAARLQSVPKTKLIGYYSDMYKLEFGLPKFNMYRRVLARVLARDYVEGGRGREKDALRIARLLLRDNALRIFNVQGASKEA